MSLSMLIATLGKDGSYLQPGVRPCRCGTWADPYWIVEGSSSTGGNCSFGHQENEAAARAQLTTLRIEHPEYTTWEIGKYTPMTMIELVRTEDPS